MDKKQKQQRQKSPTRDELDDGVTPRGAGFDTAAGRAAQGMRPDIAKGGGDTVGEDAANGDTSAEEGRFPGDISGAVGASDADNVGGFPDAEADLRSEGRLNLNDADREKLSPDSTPQRET